MRVPPTLTTNTAVEKLESKKDSSNQLYDYTALAPEVGPPDLDLEAPPGKAPNLVTGAQGQPNDKVIRSMPSTASPKLYGLSKKFF